MTAAQGVFDIATSENGPIRRNKPDAGVSRRSGLKVGYFRSKAEFQSDGQLHSHPAQGPIAKLISFEITSEHQLPKASHQQKSALPWVPLAH